jgi:hypothetical protein
MKKTIVLFLVFVFVGVLGYSAAMAANPDKISGRRDPEGGGAAGGRRRQQEGRPEHALG